MDKKQTLQLRTQLRAYGIPTKSIKALIIIQQNPGITNSELASWLGITKQAVTKHVKPLEAAKVIQNDHPHPLWKSWTVSNPEVTQILTNIK